MAKPRTNKSVANDPVDQQVAEIAAIDEAVVVEGEPEAIAEAVTLPEPEPESAPQDESSEAVLAPEPVAEVVAAPATNPADEPRRSGFGPMVAGGFVAALIGAGATVGLLPNLPQALRDRLVAPSAAPVDFQADLIAQKAQIDALAQDLAALRAAPAPVADMSGVQAALDEASASARAAQDALAALDGRVQALEAAPPGAPISDNGAALQAQIDALKAELAQAGSAQSATQEQIAAAAAQAQAQIAEAQAQAEALRASSEAAAQQAVAQAAVARVAAAFEAGNNLAPALVGAEAAGLAVPDVLKTDIPTAAALNTGFAEAARTALGIARRETAGQSLGEKVGAFLLAQTGARSVEPREGDGPDAVLSRAEAAVDAGDFAAAIAGVAALTPEAQAAMQPWVALAQQRLAAAEAVAALAASVK